MAYSTNTSVLLLLPGLPQSAGADGYANILSRVGLHITRADNIIDGKISNRYDVSQFTSSVPPLLRAISEDIVAYYTYRSEFSGDNQNDNEWTDKFKDALEDLNEIREGDMDLINTAGSLIGERESSVVDMIESNTMDYAPTFGEDDVKSWVVDNDKLDAIKDDRS